MAKKVTTKTTTSKTHKTAYIIAAIIVGIIVLECIDSLTINFGNDKIIPPSETPDAPWVGDDD